MRLNTSNEVYEFDFKFYLISAAVIFVIGGGFYTAKRMMNYYEGREVQRLLVIANYGTRESHRRTAKTWASNFKRQFILDDKQTLMAEEIMIDAMHARSLVWIEGRKNSRDMDTVRQEMKAVLDAGTAKVQALKAP